MKFIGYLMIQIIYESTFKTLTQPSAADPCYDSLLWHPVKPQALFLSEMTSENILHWENLEFIKTVSSSLMDYSLWKLGIKIYSFCGNPGM